MTNIFLGIDFSLNSTGLCFEVDGKDYYFNFFNECKFNYKKKNFNLQDELHNKGILFDIFNNIGNLKVVIRHMEPLEKPGKIRLDIWGHQHLHRTTDYVNLIINTINDFLKQYDNVNLKIGIENYSYNSFGDATIQIVEMTAFLKSELIKQVCNIEQINIIAGPTIKLKYAGNGNAIKYDLFKVFVDSEQKDNEFHTFLKKFESSCYKEKYKTIKATKKKPERQVHDHEMISPIDDIIDAHYIKEYCKTHII